MPFKTCLRLKEYVACSCTHFDAKPGMLNEFIVKSLNNSIL